LTLAFALAIAGRHARADCIDDAAARHRVNAAVLRAIGWQESRLRPEALASNADGSIDIGAFQINSVHLPELSRHGIDRAALGDGCVSAEVAAWHYRRQVDALGDTWLAVGAYHSRTSVRAAWYANQIAAILDRWNVMPRGARPFPVERTLAPAHPRAGASSAATQGSSARITRISTPVAPDAPRFDALAFVPTAR
jgi:hypothetical protein